VARLLLALVLGSFALCASRAASSSETSVGVNKFELALQYLGTASGGDGGVRYRAVTQAMARKAITDARHSGVRFFRIAPMGFAPSAYGSPGDLDLWRSDRAAYWAILDRMVAELARNDVGFVPLFVWNLYQLPSMARDTVRDFVVDPGSRSYRLLDEYLVEFVTRYRDNRALLFYEIGNELNLAADLDLVGRCVRAHGAPRCRPHGNFSTDEMISFTGRIAQRLRSLDPSRRVSSGHSFPRPSASHLRSRPEFGPTGPDWTSDTPEQLAAYLEATHAGFDILSIHVYEEHPLPAFMGSDHVETLAFASQVARRLGKILFVGEIGARSREGIPAGSFLDRALARIESQRIPYTALWAWQFYQSSTYRSFDTHATRFNIEPGYSDRLIERIARMNGVPLVQRRGKQDRSPPAVVIVWPLECQRTESSFTVHVAASDDSGIPPGVRVHAGPQGVQAGRRPPYEARFDGLAPGEHELSAIAQDGAGNLSEWTSAVVVGGTPPAGSACRRCCD
jgi:hypothetical protein